MTKQQIIDSITSNIENKTTANSITPLNVSTEMKNVLEFADQEVQTVTALANTKVAKSKILKRNILLPLGTDLSSEKSILVALRNTILTLTSPLTITNEEIVLFFIRVVGSSRKFKALAELPVGTYGTGQTNPAFSWTSLSLITADLLTTVEATDDITTQIITYNTWAGENVSDLLNAESPLINLQPQEDGYVIFKLESVPLGAKKTYLFIGTPGLYGVGAVTPATEADFELINESYLEYIQLPTVTQKVIGPSAYTLQSSDNGLILICRADTTITIDNLLLPAGFSCKILSGRLLNVIDFAAINGATINSSGAFPADPQLLNINEARVTRDEITNDFYITGQIT